MGHDAGPTIKGMAPLEVNTLFRGWTEPYCPSTSEPEVTCGTSKTARCAALSRRSAYDYAGALKHLNILVESYPNYAEGWNQRATVRFLVGDYEGALADVEEVLKHEPRHFGALAGRGMIYFQQGRLPLAQLSVRNALRVHPFLAERAILDIPAGQEL